MMKKTTLYVLLFICTCFNFALADISILAQRLYEDAFSSGSMANIDKYLSSFKDDGSFSDLSYQYGTDQGARDLRTHSNRLYTMAYAYRFDDKGNSWYNSQQMLEKIRLGWRYLAYEAPENRSPNWWFAKIGLPRTFWEGMILVKDELEQEVIGAVFDKYAVRTNSWMPLEAKDNNAGANLADRAVVAITEAVLREDSSRLKEIRDLLQRELCDFDGYHGAGIKEDMSFHQHPIIVGQGNPIHRVQYYPGGYGSGYASQISSLALWLRDTEYEFSEKAIDTIISYLLDGQQWVMRGSTFSPSSHGRSISRRGSILKDTGITIAKALENMQIFGKRTDELAAFRNRILNSIAKDDISGNKMFWLSDVMIHRRPEYMVSLRMISERTVRPETSSENKKGYYLGDGFTTIMLDGTEYGSRVGEEIFPCWDWELMPGTTVKHTGEVPYASVSVPFPSETVLESVGEGDFVGGISDGSYGAAVMDYKRHKVDVTAKKSWFFFDDYIVALGAGINCESKDDGSVKTTVNQILLDGDVVYSQEGNLKKLVKQQTLADKKIDWVYHRQTGYIVAENDVTVSAKTQNGDWSEIGGNTGTSSCDVFTLLLEHGSNPKDASYQYVIVPAISGGQMNRFYNNQPYKVYENSSDTAAVFDENSGVLIVAFYSAGSFNIAQDVEIRANEPILAMLSVSDSKLNVRIADPTKKLDRCGISVKANPAFFGDSQTDKTMTARLGIDLPQGVNAGNSILRVVE